MQPSWSRDAAVQRYPLWPQDFSHAELRKLQQGDGGLRMRVSRFRRGDVLIRRGETASFLALLLAGELGVRIVDASGVATIPRRLAPRG